jgi:hypothetical protein
MSDIRITYKKLETLSTEELRELTFIEVNPLRMSHKELQYLREAQDEYFKRLNSKNK